jgi:mannan endo-1,4-beta-mannosidase
MWSRGAGRRHAGLAATVIMLVGLLLALAGCQARATVSPAVVAVPPKLAGVVQPPATGAYVGVFRPPAPFDTSAIDTYTATVSPKKPAIVMWYQPWTNGLTKFDPAACVSLYARGAIPMLTWEPWDPGTVAAPAVNGSTEAAFKLSNIIGGTYDPYIRTFARAVKSARGPVMIRLMHEMNGNWYPWSGTANGNTPAEFVTAWRHVHDLFVAEGATNVTWVWSINRESVPDTPANSFAAYYPGDAYVDWVSMSGFNWGPSLPGTSWLPFDFWFDKPLAYLKTTGKPVVLSEFGCIEGGGDKGAWITDAYAKIATQHPEVKAVIYFDKLDVRPNGQQMDWRIESSQGSIDAYRAAVTPPYYVDAPAASVATWTAAVTPQGWSYLRSLRPIY